MIREIRSLRWGLIMVLFCSFAFNWQFLQVHRFSDLPKQEWDVHELIAGYNAHPQFLGGLGFWHGPWLHVNTPNRLRPVASHFHWAQIWMGKHFGWFWVGWTTFAVFAVICVAASLLSFRWTRSTIFATAAGLGVAAVRFFNYGHPDRWLAWFPIGDFLLSIAFLLLAIWSFDWWLCQPKLRYLLATWACFLLSSLSKEIGYIFPVMALAMVAFHPWKVVPRKSTFTTTGTLFLGIALLLFYRRVVIPDAFAPLPSAAKIIDHLIHRNIVAWVVQSQNYGLIAFSLLFGFWLILLWFHPKVRVFIYGVLGYILFTSFSLFLFPGFSYELTEHPLQIILTTMEILFFPAGLLLILSFRRQPGLMSWALLGAINLPVFEFLHVQLFHYTIAPFLFLPVHLSVVATLATRALEQRAREKNLIFTGALAFLLRDQTNIEAITEVS